MALVSFHHTTALPRLLVSDLDGTLLTPRHTVSTRTLEALLHSQRSGIQICLASGRSPRSIQKVIDLFHGRMVPDLVLCANGGLLYNPRTREISCPQFIPLPEAIEMVCGLRARIQDGEGQAGFAVEVIWIEQDGKGGEVYSNDSFFVCDGAWEVERKHSIYYQYTVEADMEAFLRSLTLADGTRRGGIVKLMALQRGKTAPELYASLPDELRPSNLVYSGNYFLEASAKGVSKGLGLQTHCESNGIARESVVAFGDLLNDKEMLVYAGLGLCMRNGHEQVKDIADRVIGSNAEDGVAREIESWFDMQPSEAAMAFPTGATPSVDDG
ncbi:HAD-like domain-containing protein [Chytriomyces sp. MP71]|nr:HAD-like domain-containing protein [Chytriomyces sp. MP71]